MDEMLPHHRRRTTAGAPGGLSHRPRLSRVPLAPARRRAEFTARPTRRYRFKL